MELKQQDIYVALKLVALKGKSASMQSIGESIGMSASRVHSSLHRLIRSGLVINDNGYRPMMANLNEFLVHGIRFAFVPEIGQPSRGVPTASYAPPLVESFGAAVEISVWPDAEGEVRGVSFSPLHKSAPMAARKDPEFYELLALVDAIRGGRARERNLAIKEVSQRLSGS